MSTPAIKTINKMVEFLPENIQEQIAIHLREYISDLNDLLKWDIVFKQTERELSKIVKNIKREIADGKATSFDYDKL